MTQETRQPFTPTGKFIARREFRFGGRTYRPGELFPWHQLGCSQRKLMSLYSGRYINAQSLKLVPETAVTSHVEENGEENQRSMDDDSMHQEEGFIFHPTIHAIVNPNRGEWYIASRRDSEKKVLRVTRKEAHRLKELTESSTIREDQVVK